MPLRVLILGASYGSLLASKLLTAGHGVRLVCLPPEAQRMNADGFRVQMPVKGRDGLVEIDSRALPGEMSAGAPGDFDPADFDLVTLAMQEPQYRSPGVRELMERIAKIGAPCMSIMNMPPLPYLKRIPGLDVDACRDCYVDPALWDPFDRASMTLCSPDPQAVRVPGAKDNVLRVGLATNFKAARFDGEAPTALLRRLEADIDAVRLVLAGEPIAVPVRLRVHESVFVPLAKWPMLLTGNYRCVQRDTVRSIQEAVHSDIDASRAVYQWVVDLCRSLGAQPTDLVPFEKYAQAATSLVNPASVARALVGGARDVERVDRLVQVIAGQKGLRSAPVDQIVSWVDGWLESNRRRA